MSVYLCQNHIYISWYIYAQHNFKLVCGFNPFEKYQSNWIISLGWCKNENVWNHHLAGHFRNPFFDAYSTCNAHCHCFPFSHALMAALKATSFGVSFCFFISLAVSARIFFMGGGGAGRFGFGFGRGLVMFLRDLAKNTPSNNVNFTDHCAKTRVIDTNRTKWGLPGC